MQNLIFSCIESRLDKHQNIYGCYKIGPFYFDQGLTVANILRRVLLSNLYSLAIISVQIEGITHKYSFLKGVQESILEILLNLKHIRFRNSRSIYQPQIAYLNVKGPKIVQSKDIQLPYFIQLVNPTQYIATLSSKGQLKMKIYICEGQRYILQDSFELIIKKYFKKILRKESRNLLVLDAIFFPIQRVNYSIQVNHLLNQEFIIFEIWTNNGLHPKQAIYKAINDIIKILIPFRYFYLKKANQNSLLSGFTKYKNIILNKNNSRILKEKILSLDLGNLDLSAQTYCLLKKRNIHILSDLIKTTRPTILYFLNFQHNFLSEIEENLSIFGLSLTD